MKWWRLKVTIGIFATPVDRRKRKIRFRTELGRDVAKIRITRLASVIYTARANIRIGKWVAKRLGTVGQTVERHVF